MWEKRLLIGIKIAVYLSFLMPLIVMGETYIFPFVFPKAIYFRILVEVLVGLYLILCALNKNYQPKRTPILLAVGFLLLVQFLSAVFGVDFQRSMWGNHERMSGWFTLIHFGLYFIVVSSVFKKWEDWRTLLRWSLVVGLVVGFTGVNSLLPDNSIMKIGGGGTLGNKIYLANFVLFHIFIAWLLFRKETARGWKFFAAVIGIAELLIMFSNGKRGPFIGLLAGLLVGLVLYCFFTNIKKWRWVGVGLITFLLCFGGLVYINRDSATVKKIPVVGELANVSFQTGTGATRAIAWEIAYKGWQEKPIFGWGVENFYYVFNKFYNPKSLESGYYETWFDRSHNIFLDYLSTGGILSFSAYLGLFFVVYWLLYKYYRAGRADKDLVVFFSAFFIAYASQNFFVFDHLSSYLTFYLMLAMLSALCSVLPAGGEASAPAKKQEVLPVGLALFVAVAVIFLVYKTNILPALANSRSLDAQKVMGQNFSDGVTKYKEAVATYTPHLVDLRNDYARVIISFSQNQEALKSPVYQQGVNLAMEELKKTIQEHPLEINAYLLLGQFYTLVGDYAKAEETFVAAQNLSPERQQVAYLLTKVKYTRKDYQGALDVLNKTLSENANIADTYWYLSLVNNDLGNKDKAYEYLKMAFEKGKNLSQAGEMVFVAELFKQFKDYENSAKFYEMAVEQISNNSQLLLYASEANALLGKMDKAREFADRASVYDKDALSKAKSWLK